MTISAHCAFCRPLVRGTVDEMRAHIDTCPNHPLAKALAALRLASRTLSMASAPTATHATAPTAWRGLSSSRPSPPSTRCCRNRFSKQGRGLFE